MEANTVSNSLQIIEQSTNRVSHIVDNLTYTGNNISNIYLKVKEIENEINFVNSHLQNSLKNYESRINKVNCTAPIVMMKMQILMDIVSRTHNKILESYDFVDTDELIRNREEMLQSVEFMTDKCMQTLAMLMNI